MLPTQITYQPHPLNCVFSSIDRLTDNLQDLAALLNSIRTLTPQERTKINASLAKIARTQRRIDDDAELLEDRYNIADQERDELWDEIQDLKKEKEKAPKPGPHLENDLYIAIHYARAHGCSQVLLPYDAAELSHAIIRSLEA